MSISNNKRTFWQWWLIAAIIYFLVSVMIAWNYGSQFFISYQDDSVTQVLMAKNLISYRTFSLDGDPSSVKMATPPLNPTNFLTPGYPFWLSLIYIIFKSFVPAIFVGILIFAFSVPLTYFLAKEITGSGKIAFWSALVFMIEPLSIYHSGILQTEQLFVPLFLVGVYLFIRYLRINSKKFLYSSLFIFSISTLIRPILFYFLPVLLLVIAIREFRIFGKKAIIYCLISLLLAYSMVGLWIIRNKIVLNTWQVSSNQGAILYAQHYTLLARYLELPVRVDIITHNPDRLSVEYNNALSQIATEEILKHKISFLKMYSGYLPLFFLSNGYGKLISRFTGSVNFDTKFRDNLVLNLLRGNVSDNFRMILATPASIYGFLIGLVIWIVIMFFAIIGFWNLFISYGTHKLMIITLGFLVIYFAAVSTPFVVARYRLPINPLIFIFAVSGIYFLRDKLKR